MKNLIQAMHAITRTMLLAVVILSLGCERKNIKPDSLSQKSETVNKCQLKKAIYFASDSSILDKKYSRNKMIDTDNEVRIIRNCAQTERKPIFIYGYADVNESIAYNLSLSEKRINNIAELFSSKTGDITIIKIPKGKEEAAARKPEDYWKDRRVDIELFRPTEDSHSLETNRLFWEKLITYIPTEQAEAFIRSMNGTWQDIRKANGDLINFDYYPVRITELPLKDDRTRFSAEEFLLFILHNINKFIDLKLAAFTPENSMYMDSGWASKNQERYFSGNPFGSVVHIDIPGNDGSVAITEWTGSSWIFSTITTTRDGTHPVSGNREFGFKKSVADFSKKDKLTAFDFFTRGADRPTGFMEDALSVTVFSKSDQLWRSFQSGIVKYVNSNGGNAEVRQPATWLKLWKSVLKDNFKLN